MFKFLEISYWKYPFRFFFVTWLICAVVLSVAFENRTNEVFLFGQAFVAGFVVLLYSIIKGMRYG